MATTSAMPQPRPPPADSATLRSAVEALHPACFAWALACCGRNREDALDVLQQSYEKLLDGRARFDQRSSFKTWLFSVIRRTAAEHRRREWVRQLRTAFLGQEPRPSNPGPERAALTHQSTEALIQALETLSLRQREVLHLVLQQDLSIGEAAEILGLPLGTARKHYERGKHNLLERLTAAGVERP